ncbi:MAG: energy-coupling factor ABC transporter ATP-binding protein [Bacteroidota bacterium]
MSAAITLRQFSFRYASQQTWALSNISFILPERACCAVLGVTSAGKSTLLQSISGLLGKHHRDASVEGEITIHGEEKATGIPTDILFPTVGLLLQDPFVMLTGIHETVQEEIAFTLLNLGVSQHEIESKVQNALRSLHIEKLAQRHPLQLSGGEVQRVALATVLVAEPKILLLDEPRNSLDCTGLDTLVSIMRNLKERQTIIFADYQVDLAFSVADYILVLHEGKGLFFGEKASFVKQYDEFSELLFPDPWGAVLEKINDVTQSPRHLQRWEKKVGLSYAST